MFVVIVEKWDHEGRQEVVAVGPWTEREWAEDFAFHNSSEWVECEVCEIVKPSAFWSEAA